MRAMVRLDLIWDIIDFGMRMFCAIDTKMNFIVKYRHEIGLYCVDVSNFRSYFFLSIYMIVVFA